MFPFLILQTIKAQTNIFILCHTFLLIKHCKKLLQRPFLFLFFVLWNINLSNQSKSFPRMSPWNVTRTSPKDPIWPSRGGADLTSWGRLNLTFWGRPEMMSKGCPNLTFQGHPWEVDSRCPQDVLRTFPRGSSVYSNLDVPTVFFNFFFRTYSIDQIYLKAFQRSRCINNAVKLLRWSIFCKIS